jgi:DNA-directed RNA polymerase specialized sigma24 family protein
VDSDNHEDQPGIPFQHRMDELPMNPYGRLHSGNEWSRSPFLIHEDLLVSAAVAGQDEAFVELCRRTSGRALTAIYRITQNRKDARDVFQESISIALLHLNQFKPDSSFSTWLTRIGIKCALMLRRRRRVNAENSAAHSPTSRDPQFPAPFKSDELFSRSPQRAHQ